LLGFFIKRDAHPEAMDEEVGGDEHGLERSGAGVEPTQRRVAPPHRVLKVCATGFARARTRIFRPFTLSVVLTFSQIGT
jgi:hypothetical protein